MRKCAVRSVVPAFVLLLCIVSANCIRPSRTIVNLLPGVWATRHGDAAQRAFLQEAVPNAVQVAWELRFDRGLDAAPIVQDDLIVTAVSGGGLQTTAAADGGRYWGRRFRGDIVGQPIRVNDRVFFALSQRGGSVYALDLRRGRRLWNRDLDGRAAADAAYADEVVYVPTDRGELYALHAASGQVLWRTRIHAPAAQPPLIAGDEILIATTRDSLVRVQRQSGTVRSKHALGGTPSAPLALSGDTIVVALFPGVVAAFAGRGERELWRHSLQHPVLAAPVLADDGVYVLNRHAQVFRLELQRAVELASLGGSTTESLTVTANGIIVGKLDGLVLFLRRDGVVVWQEQLAGSVRAPAVVSDANVYVATLAGRLVKLSRSTQDST